MEGHRRVAVYQSGHPVEELLGVRVAHVGVQGFLVTPDLQAEHGVLIGQVGVETVGLAAVVVAGGRGHLAAGGRQVFPMTGQRPGAADHDKHGSSLEA